MIVKTLLGKPLESYKLNLPQLVYYYGFCYALYTFQHYGVGRLSEKLIQAHIAEFYEIAPKTCSVRCSLTIFSAIRPRLERKPLHSTPCVEPKLGPARDCGVGLLLMLSIRRQEVCGLPECCARRDGENY